jgi:Ca-activated chloride channel family protein
MGLARVRWTSITDGEQHEDSLPLTLERPQAPKGTLGVAAAVADLARLVKAGGWADDEQGGPLLLQRRVDALVEQDAPGAAELATLLREVSDAR